MVHLGWRNALMLTSVVAPMLVLAWLLYATDRPREHRAINAREFEIIAGSGETRLTATKAAKYLPASWKLVLKSGQAWRLFAAYGCQNYLGYVFIWWGYIYLVEARHFSLVRGGFALAAITKASYSERLARAEKGFRNARAENEPETVWPISLAKPEYTSNDVSREGRSPSITLSTLRALDPPNLTTHAGPAEPLRGLHFASIHRGIHAVDKAVQQSRQILALP